MLWYVDRYDVWGKEKLRAVLWYDKAETENEFGCGREHKVRIRTADEPDCKDEWRFGEIFVGYNFRGHERWRPIILDEYDGEEEDEDPKDARKQIASWRVVNREYLLAFLRSPRLMACVADEISDSEAGIPAAIKSDISTVAESQSESVAQDLTLDEYKQLYADALGVPLAEPPLSATDSDYGYDRDTEEDDGSA